jgi:hypothetical protein
MSEARALVRGSVRYRFRDFLSHEEERSTKSHEADDKISSTSCCFVDRFTGKRILEHDTTVRCPPLRSGF